MAHSRLYLAGLCSLGVGFAAANILPNTVFMDQLKEIVQMYRNGLPVPVPENISKTIKTVMDDMQIIPRDRELIQPFTMYGFDLFHAGSMYTTYGAIVGIPSNFYYTGIEDVDTENITVLNQKIDWLSSVAQSFKESIILSEEAQQFLIAREIASVNSPFVFLKPLYPLSTACMIYGIVYQISRRLHLKEGPPIYRGLLLTIASFFGIGMWAFLQDFTTIQVEIEADKAACALGEKYVRGGLEAYSKLVQRNISLHELMGSKGKSMYTPTGNEVYFIRQKHLPLSYRKAYMETLLTDSKSETKSKTSEHVAASSVT